MACMPTGHIGNIFSVKVRGEEGEVLMSVCGSLYRSQEIT